MTWRKRTYQPDYKNTPFRSVHLDMPLYVPSPQKLAQDMEEWRSPYKEQIAPSGTRAMLPRPALAEVHRNDKVSFNDDDFTSQSLFDVGLMLELSGIELPHLGSDCSPGTKDKLMANKKIAITDDPNNILFFHMLGMIPDVEPYDAILCIPTWHKMSDKILYRDYNVVYDQETDYMGSFLTCHYNVMEGNTYEYHGALPSFTEEKIIASMIADNMWDVYTDNCCVVDTGGFGVMAGEKVESHISANEAAMLNAMCDVVLQGYEDVTASFRNGKLMSSSDEPHPFAPIDEILSLSAMEWQIPVLERHLPKTSEYEKHPLVRLAYDLVGLMLSCARSQGACMRIMAEQVSSDQCAVCQPIRDLQGTFHKVSKADVYGNVYKKAKRLYRDSNMESYVKALQQGIPTQDLMMDIDWARNR